MLLTSRLIDRLNRVFNKTGAPVPAMRVNPRDGAAMTWQVADGMLTLTPAAGSVALAQTIDLSIVTLRQLANALTILGYTVSGLNQAVQSLSALVLMDGGSSTGASNGNLLSAFTSWHWAFLDAAAAELDAVRAQVAAIPAEMSTTTADGSWLDLLGSYYNVPRNPSELDSQYGPRIIAQVLLPKCNNFAIAALIQQVTGQRVTVTNVTLPGGLFPVYDGSIKYDGSHVYNATGTQIYGLFDVVLGYDLTSANDPTSFLATITALIEQVRAAGRHLRSLSLSASQLNDTAIKPTEAGDTMTVTRVYTYNGANRYDGSFDYGPEVVTGPIATLAWS